MDKLLCDYCKNVINHYDNYTLGQHYSSLRKPYHMSCIDEAMKNNRFFNKPYKQVDPDDFIVDRWLYYVNIFPSIFLILFFIIFPFIVFIIHQNLIGFLLSFIFLLMVIPTDIILFKQYKYRKKYYDYYLELKSRSNNSYNENDDTKSRNRSKTYPKPEDKWGKHSKYYGIR